MRLNYKKFIYFILYKGMNGGTSFVSTRKASEIIGVHPNTLRAWEKNGKICAVRTNGGHRLYDVHRFIRECEESKPKSIICYARVSSRKQSDDLQRQIKVLRENYPDASIVSDISSGLNYKRRGLQSILERALQDDSIVLIITHKDRLTRFGFEIIETIIHKNDGKIVVLSEDKLSPEEELTEDMLSIIHSFSSRLYGLRKYERIEI